MTTKFYITDIEASRTREHVDFCVADAKGRTIGCAITRQTADIDPAPAREYHSFYEDMWIGEAFYGRVYATRNGVSYGAYQRGRYFRTEAEREAYVAKRIADSRKAATKKAAAL